MAEERAVVGGAAVAAVVAVVVFIIIDYCYHYLLYTHTYIYNMFCNIQYILYNFTVHIPLDSTNLHLAPCVQAIQSAPGS